MTSISDQEIKEIVKRVVDQSLGGRLAAFMQEKENTSTPESLPGFQSATPTNDRSVAIGADHGGFDLKEKLRQHLTERGFQVIDCGPSSTASVDYPDFAHAVAQKVSTGQAWRGIMIDGAGIGSCMTANKVPGVRAAMCYDYATAVNSREHNDANLLTLGAGLIGINQAKLIVDTWISTPFGGGRHAKRVDKMIEVEKTYLKRGN